MKHNQIQVLIKKIASKLFFVLSCLKAEALFFVLTYCMFRYSFNKIFLGLSVEIADRKGTFALAINGAGAQALLEYLSYLCS